MRAASACGPSTAFQSGFEFVYHSLRHASHLQSFRARFHSLQQGIKPSFTKRIRPFKKCRSRHSTNISEYRGIKVSPTLKIRWDYRRSGSNRHIVRYAILSRARLPIPPRRQLSVKSIMLVPSPAILNSRSFLKIRSRRNKNPGSELERSEPKTSQPSVFTVNRVVNSSYYKVGETAPGGGRTHNLRLRRPALYPIELRVLNE